MTAHHKPIFLPGPQAAPDLVVVRCAGLVTDDWGSTAHLVLMDDITHLFERTELEPLMGVEDLAEYLGVPVQTIYDWRVSGKTPPAYRFGKRIKFAVSDVRDWMAQQREGGEGRG